MLEEWHRQLEWKTSGTCSVYFRRPSPRNFEVPFFLNALFEIALVLKNINFFWLMLGLAVRKTYFDVFLFLRKVSSIYCLAKSPFHLPVSEEVDVNRKQECVQKLCLFLYVLLCEQTDATVHL